MDTKMEVAFQQEPLTRRLLEELADAVESVSPAHTTHTDTREAASSASRC